MTATSSQAPTPEAVRERIHSLPRRFRRDSANGLAAEWELRLGPQAFSIRVADHGCTVRPGPGSAPQAVISADPSVWMAMDEGRVIGGQAFLDQRLEIEGNLDLAVRLQTLFRPHRGPWKTSSLDQVDVSAGDLALSCYIMGRGSPLVMLHGLGGTKVSLFPLFPPLAERYRVIVPDLPGHGGSAKPRGAEYSPRFYARVVRLLMDELGAEQATVLGNSLGGRIAVELALRSPSRVTSLALLAPSVPGFRWRSVLRLTNAFPTGLGAIPFPLRERWMQAALRRLFADPERLSPQAYAVAASEFSRIYGEAAARVAFLASLRHIVKERPEPFYRALGRITQPTLVLFGEQDRLVPLRLGVRLAQELPRATFVTVPNVGHVPQIEAPHETLAALIAFFSEAPPGYSGGSPGGPG